MRKDMRFIIGGGILLILGIILFFLGFSTIQNIEAYDVEGIPISEFLMTISEDTRDTYQLAQISEKSGIVLLIIGICLMVGGIFIPDIKVIPEFTPTPQNQVIKKPSPVSYDEAQNILRTRYAKGEVTKEQYDQMKKDLEK